MGLGGCFANQLRSPSIGERARPRRRARAAAKEAMTEVQHAESGQGCVSLNVSLAAQQRGKSGIRTCALCSHQ